MTDVIEPDTRQISGGSLARVSAALAAAGIETRIVTYPDGTRTAADAAAAVGCHVGQIAKSIIFRAVPSDRVVLVLTSGANRVDEKKVAAGLADILVGDKLTKADASFIRDKTGFAIGGVAPVGHLYAPIVAMDETLQHYQTLWAAAGTASTVFPLSPAQLIALTNPRILDVKVD
jgi:prolyl-tRNA editing enzyme YbaK/EbsC (Cys-tRNA(Pro) deacylase)